MAEISRFRTRELRVKLSEDEYAIIIQKSHEAEINISDAVRLLIVYGSINAKWLDKESKEIMNNANKNIRALVDST